MHLAIFLKIPNEKAFFYSQGWFIILDVVIFLPGGNPSVGLPDGMFSLHDWGCLSVCLCVCVSVCPSVRLSAQMKLCSIKIPTSPKVEWVGFEPWNSSIMGACTTNYAATTYFLFILGIRAVSLDWHIFYDIIHVTSSDGGKCWFVCVSGGGWWRADRHYTFRASAKWDLVTFRC